MKKIWKFDVLPYAFTIEMPKGAPILSVQCQPHYEPRTPQLSIDEEHWQVAGPRIWALVDPSAEKVERRFVTVGTGHAVPDGTDHVERPTIDDAKFVPSRWLGGALVFHMFDLGEVPLIGRLEPVT